jgi:hypothetical protein
LIPAAGIQLCTNFRLPSSRKLSSVKIQSKAMMPVIKFIIGWYAGLEVKKFLPFEGFHVKIFII